MAQNRPRTSQSFGDNTLDGEKNHARGVRVMSGELPAPADFPPPGLARVTTSSGSHQHPMTILELAPGDYPMTRRTRGRCRQPADRWTYRRGADAGTIEPPTALARRAGRPVGSYGLPDINEGRPPNPHTSAVPTMGADPCPAHQRDSEATYWPPMGRTVAAT